MFAKFILPIRQLVALVVTIAVCMWLWPLNTFEVVIIAIFAFSATNAVGALLSRRS